MPVAIVERIRLEIVERLTTLTESGTENTLAAEVIEPTRLGGYRPRDLQIVVNQGPTIGAPDLNLPGNPPASGVETTFTIRGRNMPSERDTESKDELANEFAADIRKVICTPSNWWTMDGLAIDTQFGDWELEQSDTGGTVVVVPLSVKYRHNEGDPYTVR